MIYLNGLGSHAEKLVRSSGLPGLAGEHEVLIWPKTAAEPALSNWSTGDWVLATMMPSSRRPTTKNVWLEWRWVR